MSLDSSVGLNNVAKNNTTQSSSLNINTKKATKRIMWALNPKANVLGQNITERANNNSNDANVGCCQNRNPRKKEKTYRGREK